MSAASRPRLAKTPVVEVDDPPEWAFASLDKIKTEKRNWLLKDRIAYGTLAMLDGEKGCGKSTFAAALAAVITAGVKMPGSKKGDKGAVLWLTTEESYSISVRPRLIAAGADMTRIHCPGTDDHGQVKSITFPSKSKTVQDAIVALGIRMVVFDPLCSHIDAGTNENMQGEIRPILEGMARLADATSCLMLGIRQYGKDRSKSRADQGLGSAAIAAVARTMLSIDHPDERKPRHVLRVVRTNLGKVPLSLQYDHIIEGDQVVCGKWKEVAEEDDDAQADQLDKGERVVRADAKKLLRLMLAKDWIPAKAVIAEAESTGISLRTLNTAKAELNIATRRIGHATPAYWEWGPPKEGW